MELRPMAVKALSLNPWSVREFPAPVIYFIYLLLRWVFLEHAGSLWLWWVEATLRCGEQASQCSGSSVAEHGLQGTDSVVVGYGHGCGVWTRSLRDMWDLPRPGVEPASPALTCGLVTTGPPGQSSQWLLKAIYRHLMQTLFSCQGWQIFL